MKPEILKDIAREFVEKFYPGFATDLDTIWDVFSDSNIDASTVTPAPGGGFGFAGGNDPEYNDMAGQVAIFFLAYQQIKASTDIDSAGIEERISKVCEILNINPDMQKKVSEVIDLCLFSSEVKKSVPELTYAVWHNDSEPAGKLISTEIKGEILEGMSKYKLLVLKENTFTHFFINGKKVKGIGGELLYRILEFILKNKGAGGTAWNIAKNIHDVDEAAKVGDLKKMAGAVKQSPMRERAMAQAKAKYYQDDVASFSKLTRRRITDLNSYLSKNLDTKLVPNTLDEYELTPSIEYCLIEKRTDL